MGKTVPHWMLFILSVRRRINAIGTTRDRARTLDVVDLARGRAEEDEEDVVEDERGDLEERTGSAAECLRDDEGEEEGRGRGKLLGENGDGAARVIGDLRQGGDETRGERRDCPWC